MKKFFAAVLVLFTALCLSVAPVQAKWKGEAQGNVGGHFGQIRIELNAYTIDLTGETLIPGWTGSFQVTVTNTGNIPVLLSYTTDKPTYLTITSTIDIPPEIAAGVSELVTVNLAIAEDIDSSLQDTDMTFDITFIGDQL